MTGRGNANRRRRRPVQARSQATVDYVIEAAARVFRREGFGATTNRIAVEAGVSIGTLYEYFPDKRALLVALAERHVDLAERGIRAAIERGGTTRELLADLQRAIMASHRYPSQALDLVAAGSPAGPGLGARAAALREEVLRALTARAAALPEPALRARAAFGAIGELTSRAMYELTDPAAHAALAHHLLEMAAGRLDA